MLFTMIKLVVISGVGLGAIALTGLWYFQRDIIYPAKFPQNSRTEVDLPSTYGMDKFEQLRILTADNINLHAYLIMPSGPASSGRRLDGQDSPSPKTTLLYLHANAGNMGHRLPIAASLMSVLNCNILMLSYRGYGLSEGSPSEPGIQKDLDATMDFLQTNPVTKGTKIVLYAQSIGGAVAIDTAQRYEKRISGMILENTFTSLPDVVSNIFPPIISLFVKPFLMDTWDSKSRIARISSIPILFLSGLKDTLVPPSHMSALNKIAKTFDKRPVDFVGFENGNHNDTCSQPKYFTVIQTWWNRNSF
ncbi:Protein bem46 [Smittium mucronatum]|uniref:Protein bem46 n=1 Tax=Smittium mucronatum TaxID=133383 RepID=A0A1R0GZW6_9FUNG|nr:Protein bem46 [Smittium mucronatum]